MREDSGIFFLIPTGENNGKHMPLAFPSKVPDGHRNRAPSNSQALASFFNISASEEHRFAVKSEFDFGVTKL